MNVLIVKGKRAAVDSVISKLKSCKFSKLIEQSKNGEVLVKIAGQIPVENVKKCSGSNVEIRFFDYDYKESRSIDDAEEDSLFKPKGVSEFFTPSEFDEYSFRRANVVAEKCNAFSSQRPVEGFDYDYEENNN